VKRLAAFALVLLAAAPAFAQRNEISGLAGYTTPGHIDEKAVGITELETKGSFTWGATAGHFFSDHVGVEVSWTRQQSGLVIGTSAGTAELFDMKLDLLHGSFVYQLGGAQSRWRPFFLAGLGATFLDAEDLEGETKLSWAVGAGLKWFPSAKLGARLQARYAPTRLNDTSSTFCDPFGFCQGSLHQFELLGGVVLRF
jgi:opacity protein-like surface antigen